MGLAVLLAVVLSACPSVSSKREAALQGERLEVLAVWSGGEQAQFRRVLDEFERRTGVEVTYTSAGHGVPNALAARLAEGNPPDVAFLPQPGLLRRYAEEGALVPLDDRVGRELAHNYADVWRRLVSVGDRLYGVPFKAANKSLVWYDVASFERAGVVPPGDLDGLRNVARTLVARGIPAFSLGGADGWTLTDWFENLYLRTAGTERYDLLADHALPWSDTSVVRTLELLLDVLEPDAIMGGTATALTTRFEASVERAFGTSGAAGMVVEGDFVAGAIQARTRAELGVDVDVFPFPSAGQSGPAVVGGGDLAVLTRPSRAGAAFMRFLAQPAAASLWAREGGFISPNLNLDLGVYPDDISRGLARAVLDAGDTFRFDLSDLAPARFGGTEGQGMRQRLQDLLVTRDAEATARLLEADAAEAYGR